VSLYAPVNKPRVHDNDIDPYLNEVVYPALWDRLDSAFPEFGWKRHGDNWIATSWPGGFPYSVGHEVPSRLYVWRQAPYVITIQGHPGDGVRLLNYVNRGTKPTGLEFIEAVRTLCQKAGVMSPERDLTEEQIAKVQANESRRGALGSVVAHCRKALRTPAGADALKYLNERGYSDKDIEDLGYGYFDSVANVRKALEEAGSDVQAARDAVLLWDSLVGYITIPWLDEAGNPLTIYGRWKTKTAPEGKPKTIALPGERTKSSALYLDRALRAGHKDLVAVEGVFDAGIAQARGDSRVIAYVAASFSHDQIETLKRRRVRSVIIVPDPDSGGDKGAESSVRSLTEAGIEAFVSPRIPDGQDPDEYIIKYGVEKWREFVAQAAHGHTYMAKRIVAKTKPETGWTDQTRAQALDEASEYDKQFHDPAAAVSLSAFFWPTIQDETGADLDALIAAAQDARKKAEIEQEQRGIKKGLDTVSKALENGNVMEAEAALLAAASAVRERSRSVTASPIRPLSDEVDDHDEWLGKYHGREFIGIPQKTLPTLDTMTLGLRGLILFASQPGSGKTALTTQLGFDSVVINPDTVFVFLSLEMSKDEILTRIKSRLSGVEFKKLVRGGYWADQSGMRGDKSRIFIPLDEQERHNVAVANAKLKQIGKRILILDSKNYPGYTIDGIVETVNAFKAENYATRAVVLIDYLQTYEIPANEKRDLRGDLDEDKWRIGAMHSIEQRLGEENALIVISESRKPGGDDSWGEDLADVMGAARGTYTPDMVFLYRGATDQEILDLYGNTENAKDKKAVKARELREQMVEEGRDIKHLTIAKGRDGVTRGKMKVTFNYRISNFVEGWEE